MCPGAFYGTAFIPLPAVTLQSAQGEGYWEVLKLWCGSSQSDNKLTKAFGTGSGQHESYRD